MGKVQVNLKLDEDLVQEVEKLVEKGYFKNKTEVFIHALKLVLRYYKAQELREKFEKIRERTESLPSVTSAVVSLHEEEDAG